MTTQIEILINKLDALELKARSLKTKSAQAKAWDKVRDVQIEISDVIRGLYIQGQPLPDRRFTVLGAIGGLGAISSGRVAKVLDVYTTEIVVSIPTDEYPNGEIFKVPFIECGKFGRWNLNNLVGIV